MAGHVRLGLGHWPKPMWEDYQTTLFRVHWHALVALAFFTVYAAIPLWLLLLCPRRFRISLRAHVIQFAAYGLGWMLVFLVLKYDPTTFTAWFLD